MKHEEYSWTTFDGITGYAQSWAPEGKPRAAIALVHGLGDHSGRYPRAVELLTSADYAISSFDQRGHGRTGGPRVHAPSYEALLQDIDQHLERTRERFPGIPLFLYGHSFGGAQVLCYALKRKPALAGVIASSPGTASGVRQPVSKIILVKLLSAITPLYHVPLGSPAGGLSHDTAWLQATKNDPLYYDGLSVRLAAEQVRTNEWILRQTSFPLPLLIMQGTEDAYVDAQINIGFARRLSGEVTLKVWEGFRHELHNEVRKDEVIRFMQEWLDAHARPQL